MRNLRRLAIPIIATTLMLASWGIVRAQTVEAKYFPEFGHSVRGEFLRFYNRAANPSLVYGYPITEQFTSRDGRTVQYFQRARFELTGALTVALTPIGRSTHIPGVALEAKNPAACQSFAQIPVCYAFLDFYKANGGAAQFGNPLAPAEEYAGQYVQYFDNARFEWRVDGFQSRVLIADLGASYFHALGEDRAQLDYVNPPDLTINPVLSIQVRAFVAKSVVRSSGGQTVSILVQSQALQPIANAAGSAIVRLPDGTSQNFTFTTNQIGVAQISFDFSNLKAGERVLVEIKVDYQNFTGKTTTSFRVWY